MYELSGGSLTTGETIIGRAGEGYLRQHGGTFTASKADGVALRVGYHGTTVWGFNSYGYGEDAHHPPKDVY